MTCLERRQRQAIIDQFLDPPLYLPRALYDHLKAEGLDMTHARPLEQLAETPPPA